MPNPLPIPKKFPYWPIIDLKSGQTVPTFTTRTIIIDIGKLGVKAFILDKPGTLNEQEYETIKSHPQIGARILEPIETTNFSSLIPNS